MYKRQRPLAPGTQGTPLGIQTDIGSAEASHRLAAGDGVLLYTDGLTEARRDEQRFGVDAVSAVLERLHDPSPTEAVAVMRARVAEFGYGTLTDDLCLLAARVTA